MSILLRSELLSTIELTEDLTIVSELATYHTNAPYHSQVSAATYLLSGEVFAGRQDNGNDEDEDADIDFEGDVKMDDEDDDGGDDVPQTKVTLVNEKDLDGAKPRSPCGTPLRDVGWHRC